MNADVAFHLVLILSARIGVIRGSLFCLCPNSRSARGKPKLRFIVQIVRSIQPPIEYIGRAG